MLINPEMICTMVCHIACMTFLDGVPFHYNGFSISIYNQFDLHERFIKEMSSDTLTTTSRAFFERTKLKLVASIVIGACGLMVIFHKAFTASKIHCYYILYMSVYCKIYSSFNDRVIYELGELFVLVYSFDHCANTCYDLILIHSHWVVI